MNKFLEYKKLLGGWAVIRPLYPEANDKQWLEWASRRYSEVRIVYGKAV